MAIPILRAPPTLRQRVMPWVAIGKMSGWTICALQVFGLFCYLLYLWSGAGAKSKADAEWAPILAAIALVPAVLGMVACYIWWRTFALLLDAFADLL